MYSTPPQPIKEMYSTPLHSTHKSNVFHSTLKSNVFHSLPPTKEMYFNFTPSTKAMHSSLPHPHKRCIPFKCHPKSYTLHSSPPPSLDNDVFHIMYGIVNYCIVAGKTYVNPLMSYRK
jgi:hypothetical protein